MGALDNYRNKIKNPEHIKIGEGISRDSWGRQKAVSDKSLLHGMFTYQVPADKWKESLNGVELGKGVFNNATSIDGKLHVTSGVVLNDIVVLDSFRNPRYQPNRGHIYSVSILLPNPTAAGIRDFGIATDESGAFFRQKADGLYACRVISIGGVPQPVIEERIPDENLPLGYDPEMGNIYDTQEQWRGVGNLFFWIGSEKSGTSKHVYTMSHLNKFTSLSVWNPANPIMFRCENLGDEVVIECGCADVSTEGGEPSVGSYGSVNVNNESGSISLTGFNEPAIAVRSLRVLASGLRNTRDVLALLATGYSDSRAFIRVWSTRDPTAITLNDQSWEPFRDGHLECLVNGLNGDGTPLVGTPFAFDVTKAEVIFGARVPTDSSYSSSALFEGRTDIYQTPGDIFIFTLHRDNGASHNGGVTYEFAEEV